VVEDVIILTVMPSMVDMVVDSSEKIHLTIIYILGTLIKHLEQHKPKGE
jgi:hypothetical protein